MLSHFTSKQKSTEGNFFLFFHLSYQFLLIFVNYTYKLIITTQTPMLEIHMISPSTITTELLLSSKVVHDN
jgi:hypothetical protein